MAKQTYLERMEESDFAGLSLVRDRSRKVAGLTESLTHVINLLNDNQMGKWEFGHRMQEAAATSDFPMLLGLILDQSLIAQYKLIPADWRQYIGTGLSTDFRPSRLNKVWGLEKPLPAVPQGGEYPEVNIAEGDAQIQVSKFGKVFGLNWETLIDDRLGAFSDSASLLSRAAFKSEYRAATQLFASAAGPSVALFGAAINHTIDRAVVNNKTNLPLTFDNLATVIGLIRKQKDADGEPIFFENLHVVVPPALEITLAQLLNPASLLVSGGDATANTKGQKITSANILTKYNITPHTNPYLPIIDTSGSADKTWYVFVDKADAVAAQLNFLRGHETPEVFMKASNQTSSSGGAVDAMEGSFEDDSIWWKIRHCFGGTQYDQRAAFASVAP